MSEGGKSEQLDGFLLSRQWQDQSDGLELCFWLATEHGAMQLLFTGQEAVCFIPKKDAAELPAGAERRPVALRDLEGNELDGLYCPQQGLLKRLHDSDLALLESDIKPSDRFLMERFITAGISVRGQFERKGRFLRSVNPKVRATDFQPELSMASLDIETNGFDNTLYSIGVHHSTASVVFMLGEHPDSQQNEFELRFCADETALLQAFFLWFAELDPDIIIGWNVINFDLQFLQDKADALGLDFAIGRNREAAKVLRSSINAAGRSTPRIARVPGRAVLDGVDLLRAGFWSFESFALENVAQELLGRGKNIDSTGLDKVAEINRQFRDSPLELAQYNFRDCELVSAIFAKADLRNFAIERAKMTGLALDRNGGSVAAFDNLYLPRLHRRGRVAPNIGTQEHGGLGSPGGFVMNSKPGLFENVLVLDFKSLYPSIIRTFLIDPLGLHSEEQSRVDGFLGADFARSEHILPALIEELWQHRDQAKAQHNAALSQAIKIIMNSFYGVLGTPACRFYDPRLASSITMRGHKILDDSRTFIETSGYEVIYGDTDSVFVLLGEQYDTTMARNTGERLAEDLNAYWSRQLRKEYDLPSFLEVEFETHYLRFLMPTIRGQETGSKKRYAGLLEDGSVQFKGLEAARTDWTPLARNFQRELFTLVFTDKPYRPFIEATAKALRAGQCDKELIYRKRLRRKLEDYKKNVPPHVQAARKSTRKSRWVEYVITMNGPEPVDQLKSVLDYEHYMDRQLAPAADSLLVFLGTSFKEISGAQMSMF